MRGVKDNDENCCLICCARIQYFCITIFASPPKGTIFIQSVFLTGSLPLPPFFEPIPFPRELTYTHTFLYCCFPFLL
jgi:hypothetical protein